MVVYAGLIGYAVCLSGFLFAFVFFLYTERFGRRLRGLVGGFTAGVLIAFVCFGLLPQAFDDDGLFCGIVGILAGACFSAFIESKAAGNFMETSVNKNTSGVKTTINSRIDDNYRTKKSLSRGVITAIGVALHNIPEGITLGAALNANMFVGLSMSLVIALHCFPESVAVLEPFKKDGASRKKLLALCFALALPMGVSSLLGAYLSNIPGVFMSLCVSFASGVIIYITCGDIIPDSLETWNGRLTTLGAVIGFSAGVALMMV